MVQRRCPITESQGEQPVAVSRPPGIDDASPQQIRNLPGLPAPTVLRQPTELPQFSGKPFRKWGIPLEPQALEIVEAQLLVDAAQTGQLGRLVGEAAK